MKTLTADGRLLFATRLARLFLAMVDPDERSAHVPSFPLSLYRLRDRENEG